MISSVEDWWTNMALRKGKERKAMASIAMLVLWEI
jgi:hypothetical protein